MSADREDFARKLYLRGWNDLDSARTLRSLKRPGLDVICFHCQQAVEKFLKAWLSLKDTQAPKTHSISEILNICVRFDPEFSRIAHADALTPYAVEVRYADDFYMPSEEETEKALELAGQAEAFIREKMIGLGVEPPRE